MRSAAISNRKIHDSDIGGACVSSIPYGSSSLVSYVPNLLKISTDSPVPLHDSDIGGACVSSIPHGSSSLVSYYIMVSKITSVGTAPLDVLILIYRKQAEPRSINHGKTYEAVSVRTVFFTVRHCYVLHFVQTVFLMMMERGSACLCLSTN